MSDQNHSDALHAKMRELNQLIEDAARSGLSVSVWTDGEAEPQRLWCSVQREIAPSCEMGKGEKLQ